MASALNAQDRSCPAPNRMRLTACRPVSCYGVSAGRIALAERPCKEWVPLMGWTRFIRTGSAAKKLIHVQRTFRLVLQRYWDRLGHGEYPGLRQGPGNRVARTVGRGGAGGHQQGARRGR